MTTIGTNDSASQLSSEGVDLIKKSEGLRLDAYNDVAGVPTIGYGHTGDVTLGDRITSEEAARLLAQDTEWAEQAVSDNVDVPLTQDQFGALTSFTYNVGEGAFENSTLLDKLNAGDYEGAQAEFGRWVNADGKQAAGLVQRRQEEAALFGGESPDGDAPEVLDSNAPNNPGLTPSPLDGASAHTVQHGDTLYDIAREHRISLDALITANPQLDDPNLIFAGQKINLPTGSGVPADDDRNVGELLRAALSFSS
jgi:GH24 family phage-related lysozyme (muramidase)